MQLWVWLAAVGALMVIEMLTVNLLFASLAFSAFMAAIANGLGFDMGTQGLVFALAAGLSLFILRPLALKHLRKRPANHSTNVDALIGAPAVALSDINDLAGEIKLSGETWSARADGPLISKDSRVEVISIEGATAVVREKRN
ncbi:MAG: NfeD family protein [Actinobacteria bacterium]|jgi:membrane protein implicated in regulation of membrane protease activity|nr:NfeD family protein [Actinomycetota bacterium]